MSPRPISPAPGLTVFIPPHAVDGARAVVIEELVGRTLRLSGQQWGQVTAVQSPSANRGRL